jgi:hypothetical protein
MKRILIVLIASIALLDSSQSQAGSFSFGISLQTIRYIPVPHIHFGYDFGTPSEGFSLEASLFTLLFVNDISLNVMYRIPVLEDGSNVYVGAGASAAILLFLPGLQSQTPTDSSFASTGNSFTPLIASNLYGIIGFESNINSDYTYFFEVAPGVSLSRGNEFEVRLTLGLRAHRTEFPTRF